MNELEGLPAELRKAAKQRGQLTKCCHNGIHSRELCINCCREDWLPAVLVAQERQRIIRQLLGKIRDPELISYWGKTQQERIAINTYVRVVVKQKIEEVFG